MASTSMTTSNALRVQLWSNQTWLQIMQRTAFGHVFKRGGVYYPPELMAQRASGDTITFNYVGKLLANPIGEGGTVDGNEEALDLQNFNMAMNISRVAVLNPNDDTIEQRRTNVEFEDSARKMIGRRCAELLDTSLFYQAAGANPTTLTINGTTYSTAAQKLHVQGHNTPVAPTTNRILRPNSVANDQSLGVNDIMSLDLIDYALETIERSDQGIDTLEGETYDLFVSPEQLVDLQQNANGRIQWFNIELSKIVGGSENMIENRFKNNMICAGKYRNVFIYSASRVAFGVNGSSSAVITTVRRAVLFGKDAISFASPFGGRPQDKTVPVKYFTQLKDYDYYKGIEGRMLYGLKKMSASNKEDIGCFVLSTYAAAHS